MPERLPYRMSKHMSDRKPERMSDRMSEYIHTLLFPEDMPAYSAGVGISPSKVVTSQSGCPSHVLGTEHASYWKTSTS